MLNKVAGDTRPLIKTKQTKNFAATESQLLRPAFLEGLLAMKLHFNTDRQD